MKLKIKSIADKADHKQERLVISVLSDTNVGEFAVLRTGYSGGQVTTDVWDTFWFPDKQVSAGDLVVIYSKTGTTSEKLLKTGKKAHFYYWGKPQTIWSSSGKSVVLLHAPVWEASGAEDL